VLKKIRKLESNMNCQTAIHLLRRELGLEMSV